MHWPFMKSLEDKQDVQLLIVVSLQVKQLGSQSKHCPFFKIVGAKHDKHSLASKPEQVKQEESQTRFRQLLFTNISPESQERQNVAFGNRQVRQLESH